MTDYTDTDPEVAGDSLLDIDTSDAQEPCAVDDGEYKIRITGQFKDNQGKIVRTAESGAKYFIINLDIPSAPMAKDFSQIFSVPDDSMEPKRINAIKWDIDCFKRAFGILDLNWNTMIGKEAYALLQKTHSDKYGEQNKVKKFILGA